MGLLILVFVTSCKKDDEIPTSITFTIDGVEKTFTDIAVYEWSSTDIEITGETATSEEIEIILPNKQIKTWTQADYNSMGGSTTRPNIRYTDSNGNSWRYWNYTEMNFTIKVNKFEEEGEISGTFAGTLDDEYVYTSSAPAKVVITNGVFSYDGTLVK